MADSPVVALVPAAGRGTRLGLPTPKAFVELAGVPMVRRAVDALLSSGVIDTIVVAVPPELAGTAIDLLPDGVRVVSGGENRMDSVRAAMSAAPEAGIYLVHDAARALTPPELVARVVAELRSGRDAVVPAIPPADTVKSVDLLGGVTGTLARSQLRLVQTPQGFEAELLRRAYSEATDGVEITDDAGLVEHIGGRVRTIAGDPHAFKVTTPIDVTLAEALLAAR